MMRLLKRLCKYFATWKVVGGVSVPLCTQMWVDGRPVPSDQITIYYELRFHSWVYEYSQNTYRRLVKAPGSGTTVVARYKVEY